MARLPIPGQDDDNWGDVLNEFLRVAHRDDGVARGNLEVINVKDYGAIGDGSDDSAAFQRALDAGTGRIIYIPTGTYTIMSPLIPPTTCRIIGASRNSSRLEAGADINLIEIQKSFDLYIEHIGFSDSRKLQSASSGALYLNQTNNDLQRLYLRDLLFDRTNRGIANAATDTHNTFGIVIQDVNAFTRGAALEMFYSTGVLVENFIADHAPIGGPHTALRDIWFYGNSKDLGGGLILNQVISRSASQFGIVIEGPKNGTGYNPQKGRFLQAWCYHISTDVCGTNNPSAGFLLSNAEQIYVTNSYFSLNTADCVRVKGDCQDIHFNQCQFVSAINGAGFLAEGDGTNNPNNLNIVNCQASDNAGDGIKLNTINQCTIMSNSVNSNKGYGIFTLGSAEHYIIQSNRCLNNALGDLNDAATGNGKNRIVASNISTINP